MSEPKIRTKTFNYGNEKESEWPPQFGEGARGLFWYNRETKEITTEPPKRPETYGQAPIYISDTLRTPYYHPAAQKWTESRSELNALDDKTNTITTDKVIPGDPTKQRQLLYERKLDSTRALHKAIAAIDSGNAPISEETQAICDQENERITKQLGVDAFNIVGKKNNAKSKRLRKYIRNK
jgi:hypothetical protein